MKHPPRENDERRRAVLVLLPLFLVGASLCLWSLFATVTLGEAESFIAAPLHSSALANYGQDPLGGRLQSLSIRIIEFAIRDREPEAGDAGARATEVIEGMKSPVPTVTPKPGDPTATPPPTQTQITDTPVPATGTPTLTPSPVPTRTPTASPTNPSTAGPSPTPSKTPTPSNTPTPSMTPTPSNTATPSSSPTTTKTPTPSNTATPTHTPTNTTTPTWTPSPTPSATPTPSPSLTPTTTPTLSCPVYTLAGFSSLSNHVWWTLTNGGATPVTIIGIDLEWTLSGGLDKVKLDSAEIWNVGDPTSPANITSDWTGVSRLFNPSDLKELRFGFDNSVGGHTFTVTVHFNNGCSVGKTDGA